jgi:predicted permease
LRTDLWYPSQNDAPAASDHLPARLNDGMGGVVDGFATLGIVIGLGFALAHWGVLNEGAQLLLSRLAFFVASPALLVTVLEDADLSQVFSKNLTATSCAVLICAAVSIALARWVWGNGGGETVIGALCSSYVNAANLGIPIAAYVLGDATLVAPILLLQLLVLQPLALAYLDAATSSGASRRWSSLLRSLTNPLLVASLVGVLLSVTSTSLPTAIHAPLELIAGMAIPAMLLAYGVSLRLGPRPISGASRAEIVATTTIKLILQPVAAYLVARFALGLDGSTLYAVTVLAALPTAQNVFVIATRYDSAVIVARDVIFATTIGSVPVIFAISAFLA